MALYLGSTKMAVALPGGGSSSGGSGSGGGSVEEKDIRFMDYDGTLLYSYSVDEFAAMTELPPLPEQKGLICQGWNWSLEDIKAMGRAVNVGAMYITDDGKTRIYIHLGEGRTAPMVGVCPNGTVTVDWGDGTEPDVLTGTSVSTVKWTPNHKYAKAGDYVISLTVDGEMEFLGNNSSTGFACILRHSSSGHLINCAYHNAVKKIEIGNSVTSIGAYAFRDCRALKNVVIPNGVVSIGNNAFADCYELENLVIPNGVVSIGNYAIYNCYTLENLVIPNGVASIGNYAIYNCYTLESVVIPNSVASISDYTVYNCHTLENVVIPNSVTSIASYAFHNCYALESVVIPNSVASIGNNSFYSCKCMKFIDFTSHAAVPTLSGSMAFYGLPTDCEIRVPAALYDEWIAATNWATHASKIVAV